MVKHTKGFKGLSKKVLSAILAASMIMTSSSFVMAAEPTPEQENAIVNEAVELKDNEAVDGQATTDSVQVEAIPDQTYTGDPITPELKITGTNDEKPVLVKGEDYELSWDNNLNVTEDEKAKVTISFIGETYGHLKDEKVEFKIVPFALTEDNTNVKYEIADVIVYDGTEHYPEVESATVTIGDKTVALTEDDYDVVEESGNTFVYPGSKSIKLVGKGNFKGETAVKSYTIESAALSEENVSVSVDPVVYDNQATDMDGAIRRAITVTEKATGKELNVGEYFYVEYLEEDGGWGKTPSVDLGTHTFRLVARPETAQNHGCYTAGTSIEATYEVVADGTLAMAAKNATVSDYTMDDGVATTVYNGKDKFVKAEDISIPGLVQNTDYKVVTTEAEWINAGEYTIELEGLNKLAGETATIKVVVSPKALTTDGENDATGIAATATRGTHQSNNTKAEVVVKVSDGDEKLKEGVDYTYVVNEDADGSAEVEITGIGNYTTAYGSGDNAGTVLVKNVVDSDKLSLDDPSVSAEVVKEYEYTGTAVKVKTSDIKVTVDDGTKEYELTSSDFYIKDYEDNNKVGEATVIIAAKADSTVYEGEREVTFKINGISFADTVNLAAIDDVAINSNVSEVKNAVKVTYKSTGGTYPASNYVVKIFKGEEDVTNNAKFTEGGTYTVKVTPKDGTLFEGSVETTFNVIGEDLKDLKASIAAIDDQVYTGEEIKPAVVVTVGKETLKEGEDYTVAYSNNVNAGSADVVVTGINDYSGTIDTTFNITKGQQTIEMTNPLQVKDLGNGSRATNSKNCTLKLGFGLEDNVNLSYSSDNEDVATVANGVITYQGVGECTITVTAKETDNCLEYSLPIKVKVGSVGTPTFTPSVTSKTAKKAITVTSSTVRGADGFEVQYSVRSDWWRASTVDFDGTTNGKLYRQTIKTYHSNKKYYIRVRAYQVVDGVKQYSDWSPAKTATTK